MFNTNSIDACRQLHQQRKHLGARCDAGDTLEAHEQFLRNVLDEKTSEIDLRDGYRAASALWERLYEYGVFLVMLEMATSAVINARALNGCYRYTNSQLEEYLAMKWVLARRYK